MNNVLKYAAAGAVLSVALFGGTGPVATASPAAPTTSSPAPHVAR
ncbi:hypothetical protein [Nocardioides caldifontis]|nr:hypothetical protein [Nocardioides caldifontis]